MLSVFKVFSYSKQVDELTREYPKHGAEHLLREVTQYMIRN